MGSYVYTRRKDVKTIDGKEIVRYSYAGRHGDARLASMRGDRRAEAIYDRQIRKANEALEATRDVPYMIMEDSFVGLLDGRRWISGSTLSEEGIRDFREFNRGVPVYTASKKAAFIDDDECGNVEHVGYIYKKNNGRWTFTPKTDTVRVYDDEDHDTRTRKALSVID